MNLLQRLKDTSEKSRIRREQRSQCADSLFGKQFLKEFNSYMIYGQSFQQVACKENHVLLFNKSCDEHEIKPIYEYRALETKAERERHSDSTYAVYHFNDPDGFTTIRIEISVNIKPVPDSLQKLKSDKSRPKCLVDIEYFEKNPLETDSKNLPLRELISEYSVDGRLSLEDLKEIGPLMALQDLEKLHTTFLVFENFEYITAYLGIGSNQPYTISEKGNGLGKNRFYRYSLIDVFEQTSVTGFSGNPIQFQDGDAIFEEDGADGKKYGLFSDVGVIVLDGVHWKKAVVNHLVNPLNIEVEAQKKLGLSFIVNKLRNLFPDFDSYSKIFYDPLEKVNSFGHLKAIELLLNKGLLGAGWQSPQNVASDLYIHGHNDAYRIKPISILLYHMIEIGEFEKLILNKATNQKMVPLGNNT